SSGQFRPGRLKLKDELLQILVTGFFQTQFVSLVPKLQRALKAAVLQRVNDIAMLGPNPINSFAAWIRLGLGFVEGPFTSGINFIDPARFFLGFIWSEFAGPTHLFRDLCLGFL